MPKRYVEGAPWLHDKDFHFEAFSYSIPDIEWYAIELPTLRLQISFWKWVEQKLVGKLIAHRISNRRDLCPPLRPGPLPA
jgi:hypothetical protein